MFFEKVGDLFIGRFAELFSEHICHGFSTRKGGVSTYPYDSLNLGFDTEDQYCNVFENRKKFFNAIGVSEEKAAIPKQVHGDKIEVITRPGLYPATDGLITRAPGVVLTVQTADCVPVFLYEPVKRIIAAVHAGWRGTCKKIVIKTIGIMVKKFSLKTENIFAFLGPSIGSCCYKVGDKVKQKFPAEYIHNSYLDLWSYLHDQLIEAECISENIYISRLCTACYPEWFFSHRRDKGKTGRMLAFIYI
ncbi:MAG: peptidoglycan editing factor PgeF [bacterium]